MMTLAPEMPGSDDVIRLLCRRDVVVSMGHSAADYEAALRAIELGATHATHLFNQMTAIHHRAPGIIVACLNDPRVTVEMITDGIHLSPAIVRMALLAKGFAGASLVTDAISALGMPDGEYGLGTHRVLVHAGRCTVAGECPGVETLAGSVHSMDRALFNTMRFSGCSLDEASHMASAVPARLAGVADRKGILEPGKDADIVLLQGECVAMTIVEGSPVYVK
jgi:N-acetylglucosamine-6-phosphate deacetylase